MGMEIVKGGWTNHPQEQAVDKPGGHGSYQLVAISIPSSVITRSKGVVDRVSEKPDRLSRPAHVCPDGSARYSIAASAASN